MNFFKISLKFKGFPLEEALKEFSQFENIHSDDMNLRKSIFQYHLNHNSCYRNLIGERQISDWKDIPILTKELLHVPLKKRLSETYKNKKVLKATTSGSSGFPFAYAKDKYCHALTWAHILKAYNDIGIDYGKDYQARFYGIPKAGPAQLIEQLKDRLSKRKRFIIFDLTDHKLDEFIAVFQKNEFDYIYGYSSSIALFAEHLSNKRLKLKEICPSIKSCITTSEMLFPSDRNLIEEQFEIPVYNEYGASEFGLIAFENNQQQFILNDKTVYVEIVDEKGNILPFGEVGRIIITSVYNKAHPFIRYEVGDLGAIEIDNASGKKILSKLIGRTNEFAILESGKRVPAFTFYYIAKSVSHGIETVKELKIIQMQSERFTLEYTSRRELNTVEKDRIEKAFFEYLDTKVELGFERKPYLERSRNGKLKQFETRL